MKLSFKQYGDKAFFENTDTDAGSCLFVKKVDGDSNTKNEFQSLYKKGNHLVCKQGDPTPDPEPVDGPHSVSARQPFGR